MDQPFLFVWKFLNKRISQRNVRQKNCLDQKILFFSSLTHEWTDTIRFSYNTAQFLLASSATFTVDLKKEITYDGINSKTENNNNNQINLIQYVQYKLLPKVPSPYNIKGLLYYTDQTAWKIWMVPTYWDQNLDLKFVVGFSPGTPVFPFPHQESGRRRTTFLWMCYLQIIIHLFIYLSVKHHIASLWVYLT